MSAPAALAWPPGCALPGCKHHYPHPRNLAAEGCTCPAWFDGAGWHLTGARADCASPAHQPGHRVFPLDAYEHEWRCRTCGIEFTRTDGWATCPHDPDPPRPPRMTPPGPVPAARPAGDNPDRLLDRMITEARRRQASLFPGARPDQLAADLITFDALMRARHPWPTAWAERDTEDLPLPPPPAGT